MIAPRRTGRHRVATITGLPLVALLVLLVLLGGGSCSSDDTPAGNEAGPIIAMRDGVAVIAVAPTTGETLWDVPVDYSAHVVIREDPRQLVVVDTPRDLDREPYAPHRLRVFALSTKEISEEPELLFSAPVTGFRAGYKILWNNVTMSGDGRHFFFVEHLRRDDIEGCRPTDPPASGPQCDDMWVVSVDIDSEGSTQRWTRTPQFCGVAMLAPGSGDSAIAHCSSSRGVFVIRGDGTIESHQESQGRYGYQRPDGSLLTVTSWLALRTPGVAGTNPAALVPACGVDDVELRAHCPQLRAAARLPKGRNVHQRHARPRASRP